MDPAQATLAVVMALAGIVVALVLSIVQKSSYRQLSQNLYDQLESLSAISSDDLDPDRYQQQLAQSKLSVRAQNILLEIYRCIDRDREKIFDFQQKSASSEVKAHLAETLAAQTNRIIESLTEPVLMVNPYGEITLMNPAAVNLLGLEDVATGTPLEKGLPCDSLVQLLNETRRRKLKSTRLAEIELEDPDSEKHWYRVTVNTVSEGNNENASEAGFGAVAVMRDISGTRQSSAATPSSFRRSAMK